MRMGTKGCFTYLIHLKQKLFLIIFSIETTRKIYGLSSFSEGKYLLLIAFQLKLNNTVELFCNRSNMNVLLIRFISLQKIVFLIYWLRL